MAVELFQLLEMVYLIDLETGISAIILLLSFKSFQNS